MEFLYTIAQYVKPVPYNDSTNDSVTTAASALDWSAIIIFLALFVFICVLVVVAILIFAKNQREEDREDKSLDSVLYRVRIAQSNEIEIGVAEQFFSNLYSIGKKQKFWERLLKVNPSISLEIVSLPIGIDFYIYTPRKFAKHVENQILATYQVAEVEEIFDHNIFKEGKRVAAVELVLSDEPHQPIKVHEDFKGDPLSGILSGLTKIQEGDGACLQITISPADSSWQKSGTKFIQKINSNNADPEKSRIEESQEKLQAIEKKCTKNGFYTAIRIVATADTDDLAEARVNGIASAFDQFSNPGINSFKKRTPKGAELKQFMTDFIYRKSPIGKKNILNVAELATIFHLPNKEIQTPLLNWLGFRKAPPDPRIPAEGLWLGTSVYRGERRPVAIRPEDRRRHMYIIGKTGVGKSWFLQNLVMQDIYAGHGVAFLDPHGDTVEWLLKRIPADRAEDVIYFNAADHERPVGFNIMEYYNESDKHLVVNSFLGLMYKMFDPNNQGIVGPIFERAVRNVMLTAMSEPGSTLVEVVRILTDEEWVKSYWLPKVKDDLVRRYWTDQMSQTDKFHKSEALGYLVSKFDRFVTNELMRHIIGQSKSGFDFRDVMDNKKILLVNLSKGLIGEENAEFLGLLMIPRLLRAAMSRADIDEEQRQDFYLYVDEFQNFATDSFEQILSEARKYRLNLIVANQYIQQIDEKIRDAIFGNIGSIVSFKVGTDDAEYLQKVFEPVFNSQDLIGIEAINAYARILVNNEWPPAFSMSTWYDSGKWVSNPKVRDLAVQLSRVRYGADVNAVREDISRRAHLAVENAPPATGGIPGLPTF
ncbi:DUF87 domain-containing protein [Candidatus Dojkabacteria bacterium]|nr:DUF87 domain-containing protein [Candidatus Dojkabacteria bacterium]